MRKIIIGGAAAALGVSTILATSVLAAPGDNAPTLWVNGGGQMLGTTSGAGDTIAFAAQQLADGSARGQFQYTPHTTDGGTKVHGEVTCVTAISGNNQDGGMATFGGTANDGTFFRVDVTDAGHAPDGMDAIVYSPNVMQGDSESDSPCDWDQTGSSRDLGRGNVTIHNNTD